MPAAPKPSRKERLKKDAAEKQELIAFRSAQVAIAIERDDDSCAFCWFLLGMRLPREEVHHVYSRGKAAGDWREKYTSLLCTCKRHHPMAIQMPGASARLGWVEAVLQMANETPINSSFTHPSVALPAAI